jgi:hypothetical protein
MRRKEVEWKAQLLKRLSNPVPDTSVLHNDLFSASSANSCLKSAPAAKTFALSSTTGN